MRCDAGADKRMMRQTSSRQVIVIAGRDPAGFLGGKANNGHNRYVQAHCRAIQRLGLTPHIFCLAPRSGVEETEFGIVHSTTAPERQLRGLMVPVLGPRLVRAVEGFLSAQPGPHLLHSFGLWGWVGVEASRRLRRRGIETVTITNFYTTIVHEEYGKLRGMSRDYGLRQGLRQKLEFLWSKIVVNQYERRLCAEPRLLLINYESVRRLVLEQHGVTAPIELVPYTSVSAFHPVVKTPPPDELAKLEPRDAPLIVTVSRHDPRKGLEVLLRALAQLRAAGVSFRACLTSGGPLLADHQRMASELGLADVTVFTGWVDDPLRYLQHADIFVLPSLEEASGSLSLIEALQLGLAVVASDVDGIPEDVVNERSALLTQPGADSLSQALKHLLTNPDLRRRLAQGARAAFEEKFSAEAFTTALSDVYARQGFTNGHC